jgi:hypothetical protein
LISIFILCGMISTAGSRSWAREMGGEATPALDAIQAGRAADVLGGPDAIADDPACVAPDNGPTASEPWLESSKDCPASRDYMESSLDTLPSDFRGSRATPPADFPRSCISYIMGQATDRRSTSYARCPNPRGAPIKGNYKACTTEQYVNTVYNSFGDVSACMGYPQKDLVPQLYLESNFEMNRLGPSWDGGIGQLTGPAISFANSQFSAYQNQVISSQSGACERIATYVSTLKKVSPSVDQRCSLLMPPQNPIENLFYIGIVYGENLSYMQSAFNSYGIPELLSRDGMSGADISKLEEMMTMLGYNTGAGEAAILLDNYLKLRETRIREGVAKKLTPSDFDFMRTPRRKGTISYDTMTLPEYLLNENKGYLSAIAARAHDLNKQFQGGSCVSNSYLSL